MMDEPLFGETSMSKANFYVWEFEPEARYNTPPARFLNARELHPFEFKLGQKIDGAVPVARFAELTSRHLRDYHFAQHGWPLFSKRLRDALVELNVRNVQYFPARIVSKRGAVLSADYASANVVGTAKCFDWTKSAYDATHRELGLVSHIDKLVLRPAALRGKKLVRMAENPTVLLVAGAIGESLLRAGLTGIRLTELQNFTV